MHCFQLLINKLFTLKSCDNFEQLRILKINSQSEHIWNFDNINQNVQQFVYRCRFSALTKIEETQHKYANKVQQLHSHLTRTCRLIHLTSFVTSLHNHPFFLLCSPHCSKKICSFYLSQHTSGTKTPAEIPRECVWRLRLLLLRKETHTWGWYLQSADSQLLVCFGMHLKLADILAEQHCTSVHRWPWLFSSSHIPAFMFSILPPVDRFHRWSQSCLNTSPLCKLLDQLLDHMMGNPD